MQEALVEHEVLWPDLTEIAFTLSTVYNNNHRVGFFTELLYYASLSLPFVLPLCILG